MNLDDMLVRARAGDERSLNQLLEEIRVRLLRFARYRLRGWRLQDHEDLVQDTLTIVHRDLHKLSETPLIFAYSVFRRRAMTEAARARRSREQSLDEQDESHNDGSRMSSGKIERALVDISSDVAQDVENNMREERVYQAIQSLHHEFCKPLLTGLMQGLTVGEIWKHFSRQESNLNRNTFYKRVFDCRKRLWAALGGAL